MKKNKKWIIMLVIGIIILIIPVISGVDAFFNGLNYSDDYMGYDYYGIYAFRETIRNWMGIFPIYIIAIVLIILSIIKLNDNQKEKNEE